MTESRLRTSVAMCTYNGEAFVREQLESILRQTQLPDEIVISDDCSQDRTLEIVRETLAGCPFSVRILQNPENLGFIKNTRKPSARPRAISSSCVISMTCGSLSGSHGWRMPFGRARKSGWSTVMQS